MFGPAFPTADILERPQSAFLDRPHVGLKKQSVEFNRREAELNQREAELNRREVELNQREVELNQREVELNRREASFMAPEMSEAELFDSFQDYDPLESVFDIGV